MVDTCVLIGAGLRDSPQRKILEKMEEGELRGIFSEEMFMEVGGHVSWLWKILKSHSTRGRIIEVVKCGRMVEDVDTVDLIKFLVKDPKDWTFVAVAMLYEVPVITEDKKHILRNSRELYDELGIGVFDSEGFLKFQGWD